MLLYHLQRHSDHHANPTRRYQALRDFKEAPVLPTGYAGMIVLLVPAVWRRVMDKRVVAHFDGDMTLANITRASGTSSSRSTPSSERRSGRRRRPEVRAGAAKEEVLAARCPGCGYTYEVAAGDEHEGFAAGTAWADIPDDWCCPDCGVREKIDFVPFDQRVECVMRIVVDLDKCEGLGMCEAMANEYFEVDDDDEMHVLDDDPGSDRATSYAAVQACPVLALSLDD